MIPIFWAPQALHDLESIREDITRDSTLYADLVRLLPDLE